MKLGIVSNYYFTHYGLKNGAERMIKHGYSHADFQGFIDTETDFFKQNERDFEKALREQKNTVEGLGITFNQTHSPWRYPPRDFLPEDRAERLDSMKKAIRGTAYLGSDNFVVHPIMPFGANTSENPELMMEMNCEFMGKLAETGKEYGVTVCLENMPFPMLPITTSKHVTDFAKKINSDYFKVCLDTGHCLVCGETLYDAVKYIGKEYLAVLHVHDNNGKHDQHLWPFSGVADWDRFSEALQEIGFDGVMSLETCPRFVDDPIETENNELELAEIGVRLAKIK